MILDHLRSIDDPEDQSFLNDRSLSRMLEDTRQRGFAVREGGEFRPKTSSIAVPILSSGRVEAMMSMIWIRSALTLDAAIRAHATTLHKIAQAI
ncbi:hypothetical protein [Xanthobacter agilis]|uniref:DNA-binding IclR family transcriptional regulator n=1 Tax=Xanthobacter agilis TaxID=47492 RepID=A0ABU0LH23_XANAG|nr:DNA-binding IclR family transcriptional regulator [Xanthobacter agilis]